MEWIVVDDGEDSVEDLFKDVEGVKYFRIFEPRKKSITNENTKVKIRIFAKSNSFFKKII